MLTPINGLYIRNKGNQAVNVNSPYPVDFHITSHGSSWYWSLFSLLGACIIGMLCWALLGRKPHQRLFHYITLYALVVLAYQYFTMASNLGWVPIQAEFSHVWIDHAIQSTQPGMRQIFYVRWVAYFLAFPAYLLNWAALVGLPWSAALFTVGAQEVMVVSFLIASLVKTSYKWGYYTFGVLALFLVIYSLWKEYLVAAYELDSIQGTIVRKRTFIINSLASFLLLLYPIAFGLSEGGNVIQPDSETIFYGILDLCFFVILGAYFHFAASKVDFDKREFTCLNKPVFAHVSNVVIPPQQPELTRSETLDLDGPNVEKVVYPLQTPESARNRENRRSASSRETAQHASAYA